MEDLTTALRGQDLAAIERALADIDHHELADVLAGLPRRDRAVSFRLLSKPAAAAVFESLDGPVGAELLADLQDSHTYEIFAELDPQDRVRVIDELPAGMANQLVRGLAGAELSHTQALLGYPAESAGRRMSPEIVPVRGWMTAAEALVRIRERATDDDSLEVIPVVGQTRNVTGVVTLTALVSADPQTRVADICREPVFVHTEADQEVAVRLMRRHGLPAMPVVDREERVVGVIPWDAAWRIQEEEDDEDIAKGAGMTPVRRPYMATPVVTVARSRIVWLVVLLFAASLTVGVLDHFEAELGEVVALSLFIPLLIGTGGNTGAQAVTTVVRAISADGLRTRDLPTVVGREVLTGLLLGAGLGALAFVPVGVTSGWAIATVLSLSLVGICMLAATAGAAVPLIASRAGVDPAVVSAPFITTLVDASGLVLYFMFAKAVLGI